MTDRIPPNSPQSTDAASRYDEAEELASRMSYRPLSPEQSERGVDVVLGLVSRLREAERLLERWEGFQLHDDATYRDTRRFLDG